MNGSLVRLPLRRTQRHRTDHLSLHFHVTSMTMPRAPSVVAPSPVLRQNWETLARLASRWSKTSYVNACPHTIFIHSSVLRCKPTNLLSLGFEAQTKKSSQWFWGLNYQTVKLGFEAQTKKQSQWFWGQTTDKPWPPILRLNRETHTSHLLHMYNVDCTRHHPTSRSFIHRVPDLCLIIPNPTHQVFYSCLDPRHCPPCRIHHLQIMRQANTFLHTE
jgi:hypothetical protein